eukprot:TRINITY_DN123_c0_g2_i1.p2 TRINITY_DN123_c0_g2~~TRINITY_DN123_c0_g2_i1.p2  ORF type:complete len:207 (-),score=10.08 TRINITY_DN123_c0_g2_i1:322-942(-)
MPNSFPLMSLYWAAQTDPELAKEVFRYQRKKLQGSPMSNVSPRPIPPPKEGENRCLVAMAGLSVTNGLLGYLKYNSAASLVSSTCAASIFGLSAYFCTQGYDMYAHGVGYLQSFLLFGAMARNLMPKRMTHLERLQAKAGYPPQSAVGAPPDLPPELGGNPPHMRGWRRFASPAGVILFFAFAGMMTECHLMTHWMHWNNALPMIS